MKKIDPFFKEKLNNFETVPPSNVWDNIERELYKKKNRKIIPFWWKFSSVAAVLLIGFFVGKQFSNPMIISNLDLIPEKTIVEKTDSNDSESIFNKKDIITENKKIIGSSNKKIVVENSKKTTIKTNNKQFFNSNNKAITNRNSHISNINNNKIIAVANNQETIKTSNENNLLTNAEAITLKSENKNTTLSDVEIPKKDNLVTENILAKIFVKETNVTAKNTFDENQKKIVTIALKKDSIVKKTNELEQLLVDKKIKKPTKNTNKKWQITPNIAPIYANSTSTNSPIDSKFNNNDKSYENNISVGLAINYALNKKIAIRTGVNQFSVGYNTNEIGFYKSVAAAPTPTLVNVNLTGISTSNDVTVVLADPTAENLTPNSTVGTSSFPSNQPVINEGVLTQNTSYIEVPIEVSYVIFNKKIGLNIIAGMSTLFLNKNEISIKSNNTNLEFGQSTNLNNVHYSTNIGFGLNYKFAKSFKINIEPMLKYQINTFTNDVGGYKPYFIGVYSGISFGF